MNDLCLPAPQPTAPSFSMPQGATDSHLHVLGPFARYPLAAERPYTPPEATLAQMLAMLDKMGLQRAVIAHVSASGSDHRVTLDALEALGDRARGTAMLSSDASADEIRALHKAGMRGARLSHAFGMPVTAQSLRDVARRIAPFGWHIAIWPSSLAELQLVASLLAELPVPIVLDHLAGPCWQPSLGVDQAGFSLLRSVLASGRAWLKLSAMNRVSAMGFPWMDIIPFGTRLMRDGTERLLWASDWPHVGVYENQRMPQSGQLLDWLLEIGCDPEQREQILVHNPASLYGFADTQIS